MQNHPTVNSIARRNLTRDPKDVRPGTWLEGDLLGAVVQFYRHSREEATGRQMLEADVAHLEKFESPTLRSEDVSLYL